MEGLEKIEKSEDLWLEAIRLHPPNVGKNIGKIIVKLILKIPLLVVFR